MRHRDCEVRITYDGQALEEHNVQIENNAIECYIASESGKVFEIICKNETSTAISAGIAVDGRGFPRRMLVREGVSKPLICEDGVDGMRPLMFTDITLTDDEDAVRGLPRGSELGLIEVRIVRGRCEGLMPWAPPSVISVQNFGPIHETVKKGGMHCVQFGARISSGVTPQDTRLVNVVALDRWDIPYITFKFRYRTCAILQAQGIIQRPIPSGSAQNNNNEDDLDALEAQMRVLQERIERARMRGNHSPQPRVIKREQSVIHLGQFRGSIIDLTDD
ncbi:uncharacterized protein C8Q71DRAFT_860493 [Rhodofomes roseus]|uniref:DUF7918 domain-containing protein n=1 Tax=Rhodofomes roseus TaxID=34475 RepID=A0ABQ8K7U0_9APHY|nr:uncharacterized protein C8Q71DRAFT_860493 [Rhodofomes roseus]KAH9833223.1 hypothetical protein C8Q71DRAFT_860493 [Rhodofomes roseus]